MIHCSRLYDSTDVDYALMFQAKELVLNVNKQKRN